MKIVFFIHSLHSGGAERVTVNLANHWAKKGWLITIVTQTSQEQDFYLLHSSVNRIALDLACESRSLLQSVCNNLRRTAAIHRVLRELKPAVAVGVMSTAGILLLLASLLPPRCTTIVSEHIYPPALSPGFLWTTLRCWLYPMADRVIMLTAEGCDWLNRQIPKAQGVILPNPIPFPLPNSDPLLCPDSLTRPERKLLLAVGRLEHQKGFDLLLQAFSNLASPYPGWDLVILGEGQLRLKLESQIRALGFKDRVFLPGRVGNLADWYQRADIYVMSSRFEGFPNTLGEAMAHGCPAVSFDCDTGPRDIVRHEVDGLLVANSDVAALAVSLERLMMDKSLRQQFGANALEIRERFSLERIAGTWEKLFAEIVR